MIEVTVIRGDGTPFAFRFENDDLQAFLAKEAAEGVVCKVTSLIALGVPIAAAKPSGKAYPGAPRTPPAAAKLEKK